MSSPVLSQLRQFSLRALFFVLTGCSVALACWKIPFETDVKDPNEFGICPMGETAESMRQYSEYVDALRERGHVYRDFRGKLVKHGVAVLYNGKGVKVRERHWSHGKLDGLETRWNSSGEVETQIRYREGKQNGWLRSRDDLAYYENDVLIWYESPAYYGKCVTQCHADGSETYTEWSHNAEKISEVTRSARQLGPGKTTFFHANGMFSCEGTWHNNHEHGIWNWWDDRGNLLRTVEFEDGVQKSRNGRPRRRMFMVAREYPQTDVREFIDLLCRDSHLGTYHDSLATAFVTLEEKIHANGPERPLRFHVRGPAVEALLDSAKVSEEAEKAILRDALQLLLAPLHLEAVVYDNSIWIVGADEAREWVEAVPVARVVSGRIGDPLVCDDGLKLGRATLRSLLEELGTKNIVMRLDENRVPDAQALLAREIDADIPGCTVGAAIDIALNQVGLTYYAHNDQFIVVPQDER